MLLRDNKTECFEKKVRYWYSDIIAYKNRLQNEFARGEDQIAANRNY